MSISLAVIGSEGYVGDTLTKILKKKDDIIVKSYDSGFFSNCYIKKEKRNFIKKDARKISATDLKNIDVIIFLSGIQNDPRNLTFKEIFDPEYYALKNILKICKKNNIKLIFASSCSVYGKTSKKYSYESSLTNPLTFYSKNKLRMEKLINSKKFIKVHKYILRFGTAFGYSNKLRLDLVINMLTAQAFVDKNISLNSDGSAWRPFIHVEDMSRVMIEFIFFNKKLNNNIFNIGLEDNNLKIVDVVFAIKKYLTNIDVNFIKSQSLYSDKHVNKNGIDQRSYYVSFKKLKKNFPNFRFKYTVDKGIKELISYFIKNKFSKKDLNNKKYYRLQRLENLLKTKKLDKKLYLKI